MPLNTLQTKKQKVLIIILKIIETQNYYLSYRVYAYVCRQKSAAYGRSLRCER